MAQTDDTIPFDRSLGAKANELVQVSPLVRRIICGNGGPFTLTGTCTYLVGHEAVVVIDPGPADAMHRDAVLQALDGAAVKAILLTHSHRDHSPGAVALAQATGAAIVGPPPIAAGPSLSDVERQSLDASQDRHYRPDRVLSDGETLAVPGATLTAIATPGHTSNHMAYALAEENALFSGDHVMAWSTTVVVPPDGSMRAYMESLAKLQTRPETIYWPGHGGPVKDPQRFVRALAVHRRQRETAVLQQLGAGRQTPEAIVRAIYDGIAPSLRAAAAASVLAHLIDLAERGLVRKTGGSGPSSAYQRIDDAERRDSGV